MTLLGGRTDRSRIKAREDYAMRYRGRGVDVGDARWVCPAEGVVGTRKPPAAACADKKPSLVLLGMPNNTKPKLKREDLAGEVPEVCRSQEVLALNNVHIKHQQALAYEGEKWNRVFHTLRNSVEGVNGTTKSDAVTGIDSPATAAAPAWPRPACSSRAWSPQRTTARSRSSTRRRRGTPTGR